VNLRHARARDVRLGHSALTRGESAGAAPGPSHRHLANCAVVLAFPSGIPYATGLRHLVSRTPRDTQDVKGGTIADTATSRLVKACTTGTHIPEVTIHL